ncbi:hypothetical protein EST38_g5606 [Candolleomyces aberdarensis]|uniref:DUF6535 domain-containing protein n=1 Tax=Candolleomyces aberdarensis TaxID=2316362 RepID=A0A4Q2DJP2_9AGAR|nr:hypothetical protein EST38_g5606 [Candolleomyces aberdarensis]
MSKSGSIRSNPFVTGCETIEKDLEKWNKSIKAEDCPLPDSDWSGGRPLRSRQIGFEPAPQNEDTANLALDASTRAAWVQCALLVREYDKGIIGKWHRNLDTWLVFAALFSAVITALLVESSGIPNVDENPRSRIIIVNSFWVCSLILSLNSVMLTILVKQWLAEYTWDVGTAVLSPEQTFTLRQMRFAVLQKWRVPTIIDYLPLQLLAALVLFYGGLITFLTTMHPVVAGLGISLTAVSVVIFVLTTAIPAVWPTAPYQSPQAWLSYLLSNSIRSLFSPRSRVHERPALNGWVDHGVQLIKSRKDGKFHEEGLLWVQHSLGGWGEIISLTTTCALSLPGPSGVKTLIMLFAQYIPSSILDSDDPKDGFEFVPKLGEMLSQATFLRVYTTLHEYLSQFLDSDKPVVDPIPGNVLQDGVRVLLVLVRHTWIRTEQTMDGWTLLVALLRSTHFSGSPAQAIITRRILTNFLEDALKHEVDGRVQGKGITRLWPVQAFNHETEDELSWVLLTSSTLFVLINEQWADRDLGLNADEILNCWNYMIQYLDREVKHEGTMEKAVRQWMRVLSPSREQPRGIMKMLLGEERISESFHIRFRELLEAFDTASTPIPALYDLKGANWTLRLLNAFDAQEILDIFANTTEVASGSYSKEPEGSVSLSSRIRVTVAATNTSKQPAFFFISNADIEGDAPLHPDRYGRLLQLLTDGDDPISQLDKGQQSALEMALAAIFHRTVQSWLQSMPTTDEELRELVFQATFEQCSREKARLGMVLPLIALSLYAVLTPMPEDPAVSQEESVKILETATTFFETRVPEVKELPRTLMIQCINVVYWLSDQVELPDPQVQEMLGKLFQVIHDRYASEAAWDRSSRQRLERILMQLQNSDL